MLVCLHHARLANPSNARGLLLPAGGEDKIMLGPMGATHATSWIHRGTFIVAELGIYAFNGL